MKERVTWKEIPKDKDECDYVHELQHALRLCRIKKEIEL
jgi:hypothetical protein